MTAKQQLRQIIKDITEDQAKELLRLFHENFELIASEEDRKDFERARKEIEKGEYTILVE